jgi:hypothetical protein
MMLRVFSPPVSGTTLAHHICAIRMHDFASCNCKAPLPRRGRTAPR